MTVRVHWDIILSQKQGVLKRTHREAFGASVNAAGVMATDDGWRQAAWTGRWRQWPVKGLWIVWCQQQWATNDQTSSLSFTNSLRSLTLKVVWPLTSHKKSRLHRQSFEEGPCTYYRCSFCSLEATVLAHVSVKKKKKSICDSSIHEIRHTRLPRFKNN